MGTTCTKPEQSNIANPTIKKLNMKNRPRNSDILKTISNPKDFFKTKANHPKEIFTMKILDKPKISLRKNFVKNNSDCLQSTYHRLQLTTPILDIKKSRQSKRKIVPSTTKKSREGVDFSKNLQLEVWKRKTPL